MAARLVQTPDIHDTPHPTDCLASLEEEEGEQAQAAASSSWATPLPPPH